MGQWVDMGMDRNDFAYISYYDSTNNQVRMTTNVIPEPGSMIPFVAGLGALRLWRRMRCTQVSRA